jgi:hypothetical protein
MTTATTVPTTIKPGALELAREYGVERELQEILEEGRRTVVGLRALEVEPEPVHDMGGRCIVITAHVDPVSEGDPSHVAWWSYRIDKFGLDTAMQFLVSIEAVHDR